MAEFTTELTAEDIPFEYTPLSKILRFTGRSAGELTSRILKTIYYRVDEYPLQILNAGLLSTVTASSADLPVKAILSLVLLGLSAGEWAAYQYIYPKKQVQVSGSMIVCQTTYMGLRTRTLTTGERIKPGQKVGTLDLLARIPEPDENQSLIAYTRQLHRSAKRSLVRLAEMCQQNDSRLEGIEVFYGISRLAGPLAQKDGFEIYPIENPFRRWRLGREARRYVREIAGCRPQWAHLQRHFRNPKEAFITRERLVELYGPLNTA